MMKIFLGFMGMGILVGVLTNLLDKNTLIGIVFLGLILNLLVLFGMKGRYILFLILFAFIIRSAIAITDSIYFFIPYSTQDPLRFDMYGWQIASAWKEGVTLDIKQSFVVKNYSTFIAIFYYFFGHVPLIIRIINSAFGALTVFNVYKITMVIFDKRKAKIASAIMAIYPSVVMFSSTGLRDPLVIFLISEYFLFAILWIKKYQMRYLFLAFIMAVLSGLFRPENLPILLIPLIPSVLLYFKKQLKISIIRPAYIVIFIVISGLVLNQTLNLPGFSDIRDTNIDKLVDIHNTRARGGSVYLQDLEVRGLGIIKAIVLGSIYFIFSPFPWQIHKTIDFIAGLESLLLLIVFILSIKGVKEGYKKERNITQFILLFLVLGISTYGLVNSNVGTALRQRTQFIWLFFIYSSVYLSKFKITWKKNSKKVYINKKNQYDRKL